MNESELIAGAAKGKPKAVKQLVDHFQPMVLRTAQGFTGNREDAHDITQEVFIEVITHLSNFKRASSISTWIYRITVNRSLNFIRSQKKKRLTRSLSATEDESSGMRPREIPDHHYSSEADSVVVDEERSLRLHQALNALPNNQQTAFTLLLYEELSYKEIAKVMKTSVSSVESLIFRARKNLQKKLWNCYKNL